MTGKKNRRRGSRVPAAAEPARIDLEFDTEHNGTPLGDIASTLVSVHDLLRDLATLAAEPSQAEFREIRVVAIEMRSPLTITLSLRAIAAEAVTAFQEICRDIILSRERRSNQPRLPASDVEHERPQHRATVRAALDQLLRASGRVSLAAPELQRFYHHIETLQRAEIPLKRVMLTSVKSEKP